MPTYVFLVNITEKGKANLKDGLASRMELSQAIKKMGGIEKGSLMTFGRYDAVEILEFPNDETAFKASVKATDSGYVNVETLKGFTPDELKSILS